MAEVAVDCFQDLERLRHAAEAVLTAGHVPLVGTDGRDPALLQGRQVGPGRRVFPHADVHGRGRQHGLVRGEQQGRGQVVRQAAR